MSRSPEVVQQELIDNFKDVTGGDDGDALKYLSGANWILEVALNHYYSERGERVDVRTIDSDDEIDPAIVEALPVKPDTRIRTWSELIKSSAAPDSSDGDDAQAYYAGGSEHSGQQVLGPPSGKKKKDIITDILKSAERLHTPATDLERASSSGQQTFMGTGYRLGQTENDSKVLPSASASSERSRTSPIVLKLWRDGFTVDDGPLRSYVDPANKEFLDSIRRGLIPQELKGLGDTVLPVDMQDHHEEEYVPPMTPPKRKPFTGAGHVLGSPAPPVVGAQESQSANTQGKGREVQLDPNQPIVNLAIRLASGQRLIGRFNPSHTIADVRSYIGTNHPEYIGRSYLLRTTLPAVDLLDHQTLEELKLNNSVVTMLLH